MKQRCLETLGILLSGLFAAERPRALSFSDFKFIRPALELASKVPGRTPGKGVQGAGGGGRV